MSDSYEGGSVGETETINLDKDEFTKVDGDKSWNFHARNSNHCLNILFKIDGNGDKLFKGFKSVEVTMIRGIGNVAFEDCQSVKVTDSKDGEGHLNLNNVDNCEIAIKMGDGNIYFNRAFPVLGDIDGNGIVINTNREYLQ